MTLISNMTLFYYMIRHWLTVFHILYPCLGPRK